MIQINLLRISPDSQYLEFSVECPMDYTFNQLYITHYISEGEYDNTIDCSYLLGGTSQKEVIRIAVASFGTPISMYKVEFGVTSTVEGAPLIDNVVGICSNVNFVYENQLDLILRLKKGCISDNDYNILDRNHMFLYAHLEAMRLQRYEDAEIFYDILMNLFNNCGPTGRQVNVSTPSCGCQS